MPSDDDWQPGTEMPEQRDAPAEDRPALVEHRSGQAAEMNSGRPQPGRAPAGEVEDLRAAVHDLAGRFGRVEGQLAEFHRRAAHRELIIDRLHEENQQLRRGTSKAILEPVVADLIRVYDQIDREARRLRAAGQDDRLLWSFADDIAQILDRSGIEIYTAEPGDPFDRDRHRPLAVIDCADESRHNTVAEVTAAGFAERETGRVRRPVHARFYQYTAARESERDGGAAQPQ